MKNFIIKKQNNKSNKMWRILSILFWILLWEIIALLADSSLILPTIGETFDGLIQLLGETDFYINCIVTILRCFCTIGISIILGLAFAWAAYSASFIKYLLKLPVNFFKTVPVMAIIIYFIIMVNSGLVPILVGFLMCFPVIYTNVLSSLEETDIKLLEVAQTFRLTKLQTIKYIYWPSIKPSFMAGIRLISGLSWKAIVAAEVLAIPAKSLGYQMMNAKYYLDTPQLFAYTLVIILLSIIMENAIVKLSSNNNFEGYEGSKLKYYISKDELNQKAVSITFENVYKSFENQKVIENFSETIGPKEKIAISGPSGIGKTTITRMINGLDTPDKGKIAITKNCKISNLFQEDRLMPWLNVYDNIALGLINDSNIRKAESIIELAEIMEIDDVLWKMPEELSGGMQHRVALCRALCSESQILVLDEPFRGLDDSLKNRIITKVWDKYLKSKTVILVSHNANDISNLTNRKIAIKKNDK